MALKTVYDWLKQSSFLDFVHRLHLLTITFLRKAACRLTLWLTPHRAVIFQSPSWLYDSHLESWLWQESFPGRNISNCLRFLPNLVVNGYPFTGVVLPEHEFGNVPPSSAVFKNGRSYTSAPIACLHALHWDNTTWTRLHEIKVCDGEI
jgi:hypothetical protein